MTQRISFGSWLPLLVLPLLVLSGCSEDDGDPGDTDSAQTEGMTSNSGPESASATNPTDPTNGSDDSSSSDPTTPTDPTATDPTNDTSASCDGDWSLASVPFRGETFIGECDGSPAMNCLTGNYITFSDGYCSCLPDCGAAGLAEGDACTDDGSVTCTYIENDSGGSSGVFCVPPDWGLCGR